MGDRVRKIKLIELILVFTLLAAIFFPRMMDIQVTADEYYWISRSVYLEEWITMDSKAESWQLNNLTLSGPALPKYIIAFSRLLGGYDRAELNRPENFTFHYEGDALVGAIPTDKLLFISKITDGGPFDSHRHVDILSFLARDQSVFCHYMAHSIHHKFFNEFYFTRCDE